MRVCVRARACPVVDAIATTFTAIVADGKVAARWSRRRVRACVISVFARARARVVRVGFGSRGVITRGARAHRQRRGYRYARVRQAISAAMPAMPAVPGSAEWG